MSVGKQLKIAQARIHALEAAMKSQRAEHALELSIARYGSTEQLPSEPPPVTPTQPTPPPVPVAAPWMREAAMEAALVIIPMSKVFKKGDPYEGARLITENQILDALVKHAPTPVKPEPAPPTVADGTTPRTDDSGPVITSQLCADLEKYANEASDRGLSIGILFDAADRLRKLATENDSIRLAAVDDYATQELRHKAELTAANAALAEAKELNANHVSMHQWSKERITELDAELARWNRKYKAAMKQSTPDAPKG